jgi:ABC-2 type transport system ATP-binding protein
MTSEVVRASGLSRRFGDRLAVDDLSLSVGAGEVLSLLGPNGAGKTTTFRMLAALLLPTRGEVIVGGTRLTAATADRLRSRVGLLTEAPGLWERLTVRANLLTYARLHGVADERTRVDAVMHAVGIAERGDERAGALSKGLKQRVAIARALVHDPPVVLLDEPTSGLDPANARHVRDLIAGLRAGGRAVLVSTHNLSEAEELSDRIAVLNTRLLACDTPRRLRERRSGGGLIIEVEGAAAAWLPALRRFTSGGSSSPAATTEPVAAAASVVSAEGSQLLLRLASPGLIPDVIAALVAAGARIVRVEPRDPSLEEAYLALVGADA